MAAAALPRHGPDPAVHHLDRALAVPAAPPAGAIEKPLVLGPIAITPRDLVITVLALAVLVAVGLMLLRTRIGRAMRAVADDRELAEASGVDVHGSSSLSGPSAAGSPRSAGSCSGFQIVTWDMGFRLLLLMFAAVVLGGLGSAFGAMAGGLIVGLVAQLSTTYCPRRAQVRQRTRDPHRGPAGPPAGHLRPRERIG